MVKRYDTDTTGKAWESDDGEYVKHEDYAKLEAVVEAAKGIQRYIKCEQWCSCGRCLAVSALNKAISQMGKGE